MEVGQLVDFLTEWTNVHKDDFNFDEKKKHKVTKRKATQADWDAFFG